MSTATKIGVITARFNSEITYKLQAGARARLSELGLAPSQVEWVEVPGAYEIPLAAHWLLESGCEGVIALGAVIRGDTAHFDYVCRAVERGCTMTQLKFARPVVFGVLTTDNEEQALIRAGGSMGNKGAEAAEVLVEMLNLKTKLTKKEIPNVRNDRAQRTHN